MATRSLVIDIGDAGGLLLSVEGETLTLGDSPERAALVLRGLHISRLHCEIEIDEEVVTIGAASAAADAPAIRELRPGEVVELGHARLRLEGMTTDALAPSAAPPLGDDLPGFADETTPAPAPPPTPASAPEPAATVRLILRVIDGADRGKVFTLGLEATETIGKSPKHADIVLHDLYVARVHCTLEVRGGSVLVTHGEGETLVNGEKITGQKMLAAGEVLRVGNSHLRLETAVLDDRPKAEEEPIELVDVVEVLEEQSAVEELAEVEAVEPAAETAPAESYRLPHPPVELLAQLEDTVLGRFKIVKRLGRGHCGMVFRAQDTSTQAVVALKVLSADFPASTAELEKFVKALKVTPSLHHANLLTIHGAGRTGKYCWIAREYVEGDNVSRLVKRLDEEDAFDWIHAGRVAVHLGRALVFLHQHKVVHGNITPRNVLIRASDQATKLADLMLAQSLQGSGLQQAIHERKLLIELPYLAPEQTDDGVPDPSADRYALGAVLYTLLTGQPPFSGDSPEEILAQVREAKVKKPSKLQPDIPSAFEGAVMKLLAKRPEDRYPSAAALLSDLERIAREHKLKV